MHFLMYTCGKKGEEMKNQGPMTAFLARKRPNPELTDSERQAERNITVVDVTDVIGTKTEDLFSRFSMLPMKLL